MPFATIDGNRNIWGTGKTEEEAEDQAFDTVMFLAGKHRPAGGLETMECTDAVIERIEAWGGEFDNSPGEEWTIYTRADGSKLLKMVHE
jgi:hypothetical protein